MTRRKSHPLFGARYCGDLKKKEVHDLDNETTTCQVDKIIDSEYAIPFGALSTARLVGYKDCRHCLDDLSP